VSKEGRVGGPSQSSLICETEIGENEVKKSESKFSRVVELRVPLGPEKTHEYGIAKALVIPLVTGRWKMWPTFECSSASGPQGLSSTPPRFHHGHYTVQLYSSQRSNTATHNSQQDTARCHQREPYPHQSHPTTSK
jgi:hypothetical protein